MKRYVIHFIYAGSFLFAVLTVVGYLVWNKHQHSEQAKFEIAKQVMEESVREARIYSCIAQIEVGYSAEWSAACKLYAETMSSSLENCLNEARSYVEYIKSFPALSESTDSQSLYQLKASQCKSLYSTADPNPNCALPSYISDKLNRRMEEESDRCLELNK